MSKAVQASPGAAGRAADADAMFVAMSVMVAIRLAFGVPTLPELLSDTIISNLVGGNLIVSARWTGVRLKDLIGVPSPAENVRDVILTGWDDYSDSIPIAKALDAT